MKRFATAAVAAATVLSLATAPAMAQEDNLSQQANGSIVASSTLTGALAGATSSGNEAGTEAGALLGYFAGVAAVVAIGGAIVGTVYNALVSRGIVNGAVIRELPVL